jgi:hypothetical protein
MTLVRSYMFIAYGLIVSNFAVLSSNNYHYFKWLFWNQNLTPIKFEIIYLNGMIFIVFGMFAICCRLIRNKTLKYFQK